MAAKVAIPLSIAVLFALGCGHEDAADRSIVVSTDDVHRFAAAIQRMDSAPECATLQPYFDSASAGLRAYARKFHVDSKALCVALKDHPARYSDIPAVLPSLDTAAAEVLRLFVRFRSLETDARMPDTYFVVGNGIAAGTTTRGRSPMILVGVEMLHSRSGLTWTLSHELGHTQQHYPWWGSLTGGPVFLRGTLLRQSIMEGSADLVAEVLTGAPRRNAYGEAHEAEIWRDFQRDMHTRDYRRWVYNGRDSAARGDRPPDLGYWVGYRIARSFYLRRSDKSGALHDILTIHDFDAFLAQSGYDGTQATAAEIR